ncbi:hypothetical protein ACIBHX_19530 [Nonomuraea sp. NPDC050536]|uniref:hypothetical protein n=1 Tax=Nonomuraea sp. NPDC050536 TaxID=3364366 RepID=UPI0037C72CD3
MRREEYGIPPQRADDYDEPADVLEPDQVRPRMDPDQQPETGMNSGPEARPRMDPDPETLGRPQEVDMPGTPQAGSDPDRAGAAPEHAAPPTGQQLLDQDPEVLQQRWRDLQSTFVDNPGEAVQQADGLVEEVVESLTTTLHARTSSLRESWRDGDTEQMRQALQDYRGVLERLLTLSGTR